MRCGDAASSKPRLAVSASAGSGFGAGIHAATAARLRWPGRIGSAVFLGGLSGGASYGYGFHGSKRVITGDCSYTEGGEPESCWGYDDLTLVGYTGLGVGYAF